MNYRQCYEEGRRILAEAGIEEADLDARLLLEHICHTNRNDLLVHGDRDVDNCQTTEYQQWIEKRSERIPLQHLTGTQDFMGLTFKVNDKVLIPRQDTEILVEEVLRELHDGMRVLDMCTGSGCILISLLHYSNHCNGVGADISADALEVARENAERILGESRGQDVSLIHSDLFEQIEGKFDIIVANPPYIRTEVIDTLMPEVKEHEPFGALDGKEDGLYFYDKIIKECRSFLQRG
ncbi:MAG: peptide chain release factor N(5)-glutamine methyltransferase, partial [Lachnospiraceae bacterium]|nr:peptide chain release factor N(5)-glutamine methyltransferase [Lachnospiraceae bacterium]